MPTPAFILSLRERIGHDLLLVPTVAVLVRDADDRLLLVRDGENGLWSCPGGIVEPNELPADAAVRETWEEAGVFVELLGLAGVFGGESCAATYRNGDRIAFVATIFDARVVSGLPRADGAETSDARWFGDHEIAGLDMKRGTRLFLEAGSARRAAPTFQPATWRPD